MSKKRRTVIGFLGEPDELGRHPNRWQRWRPTVALCQQEPFHIDRVELIHKPAATPAAHRVRADVHMISPRTDVRLTPMEMKDDSDFEEVYCALHDFVQKYPFNPTTEEYLVNLTTASPTAQISWLLLIEEAALPAKVVLLEPPLRWSQNAPGTFKVIDMDLTRYDRISSRRKSVASPAF